MADDPAQEVQVVVAEIEKLQESLGASIEQAEKTSSELEEFRAAEAPSGGALALIEESVVVHDTTDTESGSAESGAAFSTVSNEEYEMSDHSGDTPGASTFTGAGEGETVTLSLSGAVRLRLKYAFEGQEVEVSLGGDAFRVSFPDGSEFKIPIKRAHRGSSTKAA